MAEHHRAAEDPGPGVWQSSEPHAVGAVWALRGAVRSKVALSLRDRRQPMDGGAREGEIRTDVRVSAAPSGYRNPCRFFKWWMSDL